MKKINSSSMLISSRSRSEISAGYCHIMDSHGNFYRYHEFDYVPLDVSIFDNLEIVLKYFKSGNSINLQQKKWHN